ncbi:MAG: hypothetical protein ACOYN5_12160 [Bacteroidales bacterium]
MKRIFWTAYCYHERIAAIYEIETIINQYGVISDFKRFSDISISFIIELEDRKLDSLYIALQQYLKLNDFEKINSNSNNETVIYLNTTFIHGTGNLKIEIPAVPG